MIAAEFLSGLSYALGFLSFNLGFQGPEIIQLPLNITLSPSMAILGNLSSNILFVRS